MGAHKLDIDFEDEDEIKAREAAEKKEAEAQKEDANEMIELEFEIEDGTDEDITAAAAPAPTAKPTQVAAPAAKPTQVAAPAAKPTQVAVPVAEPIQAANVQTGAYIHASPGAANYNLGDELRAVIGGNRILEIELQAKIEIAVTHRLTTIIAENAQENKVLETKVNKVLAGIAAKVPALAKELSVIKKLLVEHSLVDKNKAKEEGSTSVAAAPSARPLKKKKVA